MMGASRTKSCGPDTESLVEQPFQQFRRNVHSQNGEDGLVEQGRTSAIYVEGDPDKYRELLATACERSASTPVQALIGTKARGRLLDDVLREKSGLADPGAARNLGRA
jgi:hypothetical protein